MSTLCQSRDQTLLSPKPAVVVLLTDSLLRQDLQEALGEDFTVLQAADAADVRVLLEQHDGFLAVLDQVLPDIDVPWILATSQDDPPLAAIAEGIRRRSLARWLLPPLSTATVAEAVREIWGARKPNPSPDYGALLFNSYVTVLSHDVRNLAAGVVGVLDLISAGQLSAESQEYPDLVAMGYQCGRDLLEAIAMLVDLQRMLSGARRPTFSQCPICDLISYALDRVNELSQEKRITFSLDLEPEYVLGDHRLLQHALSVLLAHAVRVSPGHTEVLLKAGRVSGTNGLVFFADVRDKGPALREPQVAWQYEPLLPLTESRLWSSQRLSLDDLGLSFCSMVAKIHAGQLTVTSHRQVGNTFSFRIPIFPTEEDGAEHCATSQLRS